MLNMDLPLAPSQNHCYRNVAINRRIKTKTAWKSNCIGGMALMLYHDLITTPNREAEDWLLYYDKHRGHYQDMQQAFTFIAANNAGGGIPRAGHSSPTENRSIRLVDLEQKKGWLQTVEMAETCLGHKKSVFLKWRRRAEEVKHDGDPGRPDWVVYVQNQVQRETGIWVSERTLRSWWRDILELTVRIAIKRGCV